MVIEQSEHIITEVKKAFMGKDEIIRKVLMTIYAGGHILLEDCPGVGKTTLVLAFANALGLDFKRIQFTTDTTPSDITGFSMFNRVNNQFEYHSGAVMCHLLLADEINRTSPKTQSALLESMEEKNVTVDGVTQSVYLHRNAEPSGRIRYASAAGIPAGSFYDTAFHRLSVLRGSDQDSERQTLYQSAP